MTSHDRERLSDCLVGQFKVDDLGHFYCVATTPADSQVAMDGKGQPHAFALEGRGTTAPAILIGTGSFAVN